MLPDSYSPNGNNNLVHIASIDTDDVKKVPFGVPSFAKKFLTVINPPKNLQTFLTAAKANNF
jgi:hypothetical protein